jgi:hypothetical protein
MPLQIGLVCSPMQLGSFRVYLGIVTAAYRQVTASHQIKKRHMRGSRIRVPSPRALNASR